jgi:hypothetical protein
MPAAAFATPAICPTTPLPVLVNPLIAELRIRAAD